MVDSEYTREVLKRCFREPLVKVNIKTGQGYSRMEELWESEGFTVMAVKMPEQIEKVPLPKAAGL